MKFSYYINNVSNFLLNKKNINNIIIFLIVLLLCLMLYGNYNLLSFQESFDCKCDNSKYKNTQYDICFPVSNNQTYEKQINCSKNLRNQAKVRTDKSKEEATKFEQEGIKAATVATIAKQATSVEPFTESMNESCNSNFSNLGTENNAANALYTSMCEQKRRLESKNRTKLSNP